MMRANRDYAAIARAYSSGAGMVWCMAMFRVQHCDVRHALDLHGIPVRRVGRPPKEVNETAVLMKNEAREQARARNESIACRFRAGETQQQIGDAYGITRQRVRQILKHSGLARLDGGSALQRLAKIDDLLASRDAKRGSRHVRWHLSRDEYREHVEEFGSSGVSKSPMECFSYQRNSARRRGIAWEFTFRDWWQLWRESGRWAERGRGRGYCMARIGDSGPYCVGNVEIITQSQNSKDSFLIHPGRERYAKSLTNRARAASERAA